MAVYIGIDPGGSGAVAWIKGVGHWAYTLKNTERDIADTFWNLAAAIEREGGSALIERVGAFPGQGVTSCFSFGQNYGFLRGLLIAYKIPFETVLPRAWQATFGLLRRDKTETKTEKKRRHKARAQELFTSLKITNANADALLIAEWLRRKEGKHGV